jgi:hypothetical protein
LSRYALYVPKKTPARYGFTPLMHSLGANYNQYSASRNQSQFGDRGQGHLIATPSGRGPDGWYVEHQAPRCSRCGPTSRATTGSTRR